jgi:hypothetical protein
MLTSSTKTFKNWFVQSLNTSVVVLEKIHVAFFNPNDNTLLKIQAQLVKVSLVTGIGK